MAEQVLDAKNWKLEASAVMKDIEKHVKYISIVDGTDQKIYFNLTILEEKDFCVELSGRGFRVVGTSFNKTDDDNEEYFETPYSLLNHLSHAFHQSFGNELLNKLNDLSNENA